ncbi:MAG: helix-turn-helix transcriptional regulator [Prevotellaceae bacterium]|jgi:transcriptional regulator with XRE-family HTH domain|nr:helix-turn-helix transcriptional regulator [Prevotellaceae bacterium]
MKKTEKERKIFCDMLVEARKSKKMSTYTIAEIANIKRPYISMIENAKVSASIDTVIKYLDAIDYKLVIEKK